MERLPSHASKLQARLHEVGNLPIATYPVEPLVRRSNNVTSVFQEGEIFSGTYRKQSAEAIVVVPAAPYIPPYLSKDLLTSHASAVFGHKVELQEGLEKRETLSPHLIVWWRDGEYSDMFSLRRLPRSEQKAIGEVVEASVKDSIEILRETTGEYPRIGGSWGKADDEDRRKGFSRGGPTVKEGHMHILNTGHVKDFVEVNPNLSASERSTHFHPWNHVFQTEFGEAFIQIIGNIVQNHLERTRDVSSTLTQDFIYTDGRGSFMKGYSLAFDQPISFSDGFTTLVALAGKFGDFYQSMRGFHEEYYKLFYASDDPVKLTNLRDRMGKQIAELGVQEADRTHLEDFILGIRPTFGQLISWRDELRERGASTDKIEEDIERYSRARERLSENPTIYDIPKLDTVKSPGDYRSIISTWPAQCSVAYEFLYDVTDEGSPVVKGIIISPVIGSLETSERIFEAIVKRPIAA